MGEKVEYSTLKGDDLRELCRTRELPTSGTNPEMIERLKDYDAAHPDAGDEDLLAEPDEPPVVDVPAEVTIDLPAEATTTATDPMVKEAPSDGLVASNMFEVTFEVQGTELGTGLHEEFRARAYHAAQEAGHTPKGGLAAAYRDSFRQVDGRRHAVYHVHVRR